MNDLKSAAKLSLEALQNAWLDASMGKGDVYRHNEAIKALKEALAKQEQCKYPNCDYPCMNLPDCQEQKQGEPEPVGQNWRNDGCGSQIKAKEHIRSQVKRKRYMNTDEIIEMAEQAGINHKTDEFHSYFCDGVYVDDLKAFAKLVADKATDKANARSNTSWTLMCKKMVEDEREACAELCMSLHTLTIGAHNYYHFAANQIRARS